jgi:RNA polymerase sigma factor (TIGR02999 family)
MTADADITELLNAAISGDNAAQEAAYAAVYDELKRCAMRQKRLAPGSSMTSTALVHELFPRLTQRRVAALENRSHFFALAARAMRQIIVDSARRSTAVKRGGQADFTDAITAELGMQCREQALELDAALTRLQQRDADLARIVEWHFFAGLSFAEIGAEIGRHERSIERDWALARTLLRDWMGAAVRA